MDTNKYIIYSIIYILISNVYFKKDTINKVSSL